VQMMVRLDDSIVYGVVGFEQVQAFIEA